MMKALLMNTVLENKDKRMVQAHPLTGKKDKWIAQEEPVTGKKGKYGTDCNI